MKVDPRLAAANGIIDAQNHALAKAHAALKEISRNAAIAEEWLIPVHAAIAEIEGRTSPCNTSNAPAPKGRHFPIHAKTHRVQS